MKMKPSVGLTPLLRPDPNTRFDSLRSSMNHALKPAREDVTEGFVKHPVALQTFLDETEWAANVDLCPDHFQQAVKRSKTQRTISIREPQDVAAFCSFELIDQNSHGSLRLDPQRNILFVFGPVTIQHTHTPRDIGEAVGCKSWVKIKFTIGRLARVTFVDQPLQFRTYKQELSPQEHVSHLIQMKKDAAELTVNPIPKSVNLLQGHIVAWQLRIELE